jgi:hypothetical protein
VLALREYVSFCPDPDCSIRALQIILLQLKQLLRISSGELVQLCLRENTTLRDVFYKLPTSSTVDERSVDTVEHLAKRRDLQKHFKDANAEHAARGNPDVALPLKLLDMMSNCQTGPIPHGFTYYILKVSESGISEERSSINSIDHHWNHFTRVANDDLEFWKSLEQSC